MQTSDKTCTLNSFSREKKKLFNDRFQTHGRVACLVTTVILVSVATVLNTRRRKRTNKDKLRAWCKKFVSNL